MGKSNKFLEPFYKNIIEPKGDISINEIDFSYEPGKKALRNISLKINLKHVLIIIQMVEKQNVLTLLLFKFKKIILY